MKRSLTEFSAVEYSVAAEYGKALVHLRHQKELNRFGLVFGAGFSEPLKFPMWSELIKRIAADRDVGGLALIAKARNNTSLTQLLYEHYRGRPIASSEDQSHEQNLRRKWTEVVRKCLYRNAPKSASALGEKHP